MISVEHQSLSRLLRAFRLRCKEKQNLAETRLQDAMRRRGPEVLASSSRSVVGPGKVAWLEKGGRGNLFLSETDWQLLAEAYNIPRLMLDPLRVPVTDSTCLVQQWDRLVRLGEDVPSEYGMAASYFAPEARLVNTEEAAFVLLRLQAGGCSQVHAHPGDEMLLVLEGTVEALLETTGLSVQLEKGDYLHFYSEQRHSVKNSSDDPAMVFVIRFYQLSRSGTRSELFQQLQKTRRDKYVTNRAIREMISVVTPTNLREKDVSAGEVSDRGGLGRLLQLLSTRRGPGPGSQISVRQLQQRARKLGLSYTASKIDRIHHGLAPIPESDLPELAKVYRTEPMLLYEFLYPALRSAIAVRSRADYREIPPAHVGSYTGVYRVPCRRLADSDLGVAQLILPKDAATPVNRHPGHEMLVPLRGHAHLRIAGLETDITAGKHLYVHYSSDTEHQVVNTDDETVQLMVIRFYE